MGTPSPVTKAALERLSRELTDKGLLIEAGWVSLRAAAVPLDAPQVQIDEMRNAFFAGAQHLLSSILTILDPGTEPTLADLKRMDKIQGELDRFIKDYEAKHLRTAGRA